MGEFNNRHPDLITHSPNFAAKTILDLYTDNINKNLRKFYAFCYLKLLKTKQKKKINDIICENKYKNSKIHKFKSLTSCKNIISKGVKNILMSSE